MNGVNEFKDCNHCGKPTSRKYKAEAMCLECHKSNEAPQKKDGSIDWNAVGGVSHIPS